MIGSNRPRWLIGWILASILALPATVPARTWEPVVHAVGRKPHRVIVNHRARAYLRATNTRPVEFTVQGPARIKVITRAQISSGDVGTVSYTVRVAEQGKTLKVHRTESGPAPSARVADVKDGALCKSRSFLLRVPEGSHQLSLSVSGISVLYARILVAAPGNSGETMVSITPVEASRSVTVSEGEQLISYYTVVRGKPVKLRIVGPTRVELSSRLDFSPTMRGQQQYALRITSDAQRLRDVRFRTRKAAAATYTDLRDRVPSRIDRVVLPLGPGLHELTVDLLEPGAGAVEVHARIPRPAVGRAE